MARIRTIKPEFPHSESMGRVSRDARLTFIELWTLADDEGRLRGNSRMLASLLFPYDDDAKDLIDTWLAELEREACVVRYQIDGASYVQICNWLEHQKIDKPSKSKIPPFAAPSRILANPREGSSEDLRIKDQGEEGKGEDRVSHAREGEAVGFHTVRETYPEFSGRQDWISAQHYANLRVERDGLTWSDLHAAVERYRAYCDSGGVSSPQFVMTPAKFFSGADKPWLQEWKPPPSKSQVKQDKNISVAQQWLSKQSDATQ
jgi:hypothetical protein